MPKIGKIVDLFTGETVPFQLISKERDIVELVFIAKDVPSIGYKTFLIEEGFSKITENSNIKEQTIENEFYEIGFDSSGQVRSIIHRDSGKQVVNPNGDFGFNEYIYESGGVREKFFPAQNIPTWKRIYFTSEQRRISSYEAGPIVKKVTVKSVGKGTKGIKQITTLYSDINRIEIENIIDKEEITNPEGVYFSYPFKVDSPKVYIDIPGAVMQPEKDQLPNSNKDFYTLRHWVKLIDGDLSIALCCLDAPLISLFEINTEKWIKHLPPSSGMLYSYVMNNYWFTNYRYSQEGKVTFRYCLQAQQAKQSHGETTRFALEYARPLIPVISRNANKGILPTEQSSFLSILPDNVYLQTIKLSEDGEDLIIRVVELNGESTNAQVMLSQGGNHKAYLTDLTENNLKQLEIQRNSEFMVSMKPFGIETIRIVTDKNILDRH